MSGKYLSKSAFVVCAFTSAHCAGALEGIQLENGAIVKGALSTAYGYENNLTQSSQSEISSSFLQVDPSIRITLSPGDFVHEFLGYGYLRSYQDSSADNYQDLVVVYNAKWEPTSRSRTRLNAKYLQWHQQRGSGVTRFEPLRFDSPFTFDETAVSVEHEYGSQLAIGQIGGKIGLNEVNYTNFEDYTFQFDRSTRQFNGWFNYRLGAVTRASFDLVLIDSEYDFVSDFGLNRDSTSYRALAGFTWSGLAKTTGNFKLGYEQRKFDDAARSDFQGLALDIGASWSPRTYSTVDFSLSRKTDEAVAGTNLTVATAGRIQWQHSWSDITTTLLEYRVTKRKEQNSNGREETTHSVHATFSRYLSNHIVFDVIAAATDNQSNQSVFAYDTHSISAGIRFIL